jgi:hypothetical protein
MKILMKANLIKSLIVILTFNFPFSTVWAQSPEKMSYQAVIRNSNNDLVINTQIGMQISILQETIDGTAVYTETQIPTTNANGLVSIEIGTGTTSDNLSVIDWSAGPYFIKTETDPEGGTNYTIIGVSQLLSVPYAFHAKTAETVAGGITEADPVYSESQAANITATDITNLDNLSGVNTGDQDLSALATKNALGDSTAQVRSEIPDVSGFLENETDPVYLGMFNINNPSTGDYLKYNGAKFVQTTPNIADTFYTHETKSGVKLFVKNDTVSNLDFVIQPKGEGAILAQQPDGTIAGGNNRGTNAVDLQMSRTDAGQVASGSGAAIIGGINNTASGSYSVAMGKENTASEDYSVAFGHGSEASGSTSIAMGYRTLSSGLVSLAMGYRTLSSANASVAIGLYSQATGIGSTAMGYGTKANASFSTAIGGYSSALSSYETAIGRYNTEYTPVTTGNDWDSSDRLLVVGNGTESSARSDAFTILKNANTTIGGSLTINGNGTDASFTFPTGRGTSGQVLQTDGSGGISWATPASGSVSGVGGTAPIVSSGGNAPVISILAATTSAAGSLSAADKTKLDGLVDSQWTSSGSDIYFNSGNVGIGNASPHAPLQFINTSASRKIVLYETADNDNQFFGFGTNSGILRYQLPSTTSNHVFYAGTSETTSTELFRIKGTGDVVIPAFNTAGVLLNNTSGEISSSVGSSGQVLTTNGSGGISWSNLPGTAVTSVAGKTGDVLLDNNDVGLGNVENTALSFWPGSPAIDRVGTITMGSWNGAPVNIQHGGTGATTKTEGFDALSPMASEGDIIYGGTNGTGTRLEKGNAGQVLWMKNEGTAPEWGNIPAANTLVMTKNELASIDNPPEGLMVYCTDCGTAGAQCIFAADKWNYLLVSSSKSPASPELDEVSYIAGGIIWRWKSADGADSYRWNSSDDYSTAISTGTIREYTQSGLDCNRSHMCYVWAVNNSGLVSAPLTLYEWVESPDVPESGDTRLLSANEIQWKWKRVFNAIGYRFGASNDYNASSDLGATDTKTETLPSQGTYTRYVWAYNSCGHSDSLILTFAPSLPAPVTDAPVWISGTFKWKWNAVQNASGYKWNTNNDYNTATNVGDFIEKDETGLTCGTSYTRYVWAYNDWIHSDALELNGAPGGPATPEKLNSEVRVTEIIFNWTPVEGAMGYKYSYTSTDYNDAVDIGSIETITRSGLRCNTDYTIYVWAYNSCGHSSHLEITAKTKSCPDDPDGPIRNM